MRTGVIKAAAAAAVFSLLAFAGFDPADGAAKAESEKRAGKAGRSGLLGEWLCQGAQGRGEVSLVFQSENRLVFDGGPSNYTLVPGAIRVEEEGVGEVDYRYTLKGDSLSVAFPDGSVLRCARSGGAFAGTGRGGEGDGAAGGPGVNERFLYGTFCSFSASSGGGSSYRSSGRTTFDGRGRFSYGSESSFSSEAGQAYSAGADPANAGTYRVQGNSIRLTFGDGSTGTATVNNRLNDGTINEVMYNGTLYATGLCD